MHSHFIYNIKRKHILAKILRGHSKMKKKIYLLTCCLALSLAGCGSKNTSPPPKQETESTIPGHEHKFTMQYQASATCKEEGKRVEKCSCGQVQTTILEKAPHNYKERVKEKATCEYPGIKIQKCTVCSKEVESEIPQMEHNWKTLKRTIPTCSEEGVESRQCDRCKKKEETLIPKKEHTFHIEVVESTCTQKGQEQKECWFCEEIVVVKEFPLAEHDYELFEKIPSSCTQDGLLEKICKDCKNKEEVVLPQVDHMFIEKEKSATCTENGYKKLACEGCELVMNEVIFISPGHINVSQTVKSPTCSEVGIVEKTCSVCGNVEKEEIKPLGHRYSTYDKNPTCTIAGYTSRKCDICADIESYTEKPALGHKHIELRRYEATCTRTGTIEKVCSVCLEVSQETLPKLSHQYELVEEDNHWQTFECLYCHSTKKEKK